ncbi:SGNH hydrolase-type esterase domain-containing protein [Truncatella angustata]|uniref:SGNH hydrolase-type esterase domain-containing protein n=1 Tax=Truncatella angustata TaxID=152316 RepID=A0A9P8UEE8_9PEZI|nr:SGNH hydrolase-type esterase domain-containing protein [Truncatella angustata]KAH6648404.1 SGNH hydrolase-type esterase domain-containing protein [Truncatella angustata]KAH8204841.1 hypothetical protein TruAng_001030 [Truncatella angustata]
MGSGKTPLRILCLGDSLTSGYPPSHPYGGKLEVCLEAAFPSHQLHVEVDGVPGDLVVKGSFIERMQSMWKTHGKKDGFEWTVVLGGTNDIGWGYPADKVFEALKKVWDIPLSKGGKVLALTIPEIKMQSENLDRSRAAVNEGIKAYKKPNFYTFDLYEAVPYRSMSEEDREKYWDPDGVHFTEAGYDLIGEKVAEGLTKIIRLEEAQSTEISSIVTDARQRKLIEEMIFEEEMGNPKLLSQGWIVVRKKDLD